MNQSIQAQLADAHARIAKEYGENAVVIPSTKSEQQQHDDAIYNQPSDKEKEEAEINALPADQQKFVRDNQGIGGSLRVGAESFANQALFGVPELAYEKLADPADVGQHEALKHFHQTANIVGGIGGAATSLAYGGPLFDAAGVAGRAAEGLAIGGREAAQVSLARTIASKLVGGAAEGAVIGAPQTVTHAILGDPKEAAENLVFSAGIGGLLGPATFGLKRAAEFGSEAAGSALGATSEKLGSYIKDPDSALSLFGDVNKSSLKGAVLTESGEKSLDSSLANLVKKGMRITGAKIGGPIGYLASKELDGVADKVVSMLPQEAKTAALQATLKASQIASKQLERIPGILEDLSNSGFGKAVGSSGNVFSEAGKDIASEKTEYEQYKALSKKLADSKATGTDITTLGENSAGLHNPELQTQYQAASLNALNYLRTIIPKNPNPILPFTPQATWKPTDAQLNQFKSQLDIIHNPYSVLDKLQSGTLTKPDVDTLQHVYPAIYSNITQEILKHGTDPKYSKLSYQAKNKLSLLTGISMNQSMEPNSINALQANFAQEQANTENEKSPKSIDTNSNSFLTDNQRISMGMQRANS